MADNDVDEILQKFFVTIAEKDADAFKLYEDNKRMRDLVEQTLRAREELESRHHTTIVLVKSLQTALDEKERLIAAQDSENAAWREHIAELRALLDRPSELQHGLGDVVEDVRNMSAELRSLRHAFQYAQWCCDGWEQYAAEAVVQQEVRERAALEETAMTLLDTLRQHTMQLYFVMRDAKAQNTTSSGAVKQWEAWYATVEDERAKLVEMHEKALRFAELEAKEQQDRAEALRHELNTTKETLELQARDEDHQLQLRNVEQESSAQLMTLMEGRCRSAETNWAATVHQLRCVVHLLAAAQREKDDYTAKHELVLLTLEHTRQRLFKLTKQLDQLKQQQSELEDLQQRCSGQQEDLRTLREKYLAVTDKERSLRQQLHSSTETAATKLQAAEEAVSTSQRHRFSLEERLRATQDELKVLLKEVANLRRQSEEHRATQAVLQATQEQLRETEKHSFNFQVALDRLKEEQETQLRAVEARHSDELAALKSAHSEELDREARVARSAVEEAETTLKRARDAHAKDKDELQRELQEWIHEVEAQRREKAAQQDRLDAERSARQLLERQYRQETSVVRSVMMEHSREEAQRGPQLAELEVQVRSMTQRNELLEEACRRSASVIAQLRETLHREQMVCRTLRQRAAALTP
ncbi:hypothetical protein ABB37_01654 [Leptomonas pyrrhocoris]|uniref:Uncharacterized protein n=1 Tax=Leptomonas pyrrhocoris TaxID=157538 RepID=A0A0N0VHF6_LEPPY|nr:hypothetical protein ABB37_01654 [Leptomonas pyrrhocoris]KPA85321.1 hypothetical protein ABB37_01654 [Leptomonas pyrrhocoris]|eukprot:XP_015663760.1 hypothetical protein ABB37_01654 [Leptomonas pyrrhocoris]